jgi:hypothetical protein
MSYTDHQASRDAAYSRAYRKWTSSLPPEDRARLASHGLAAPDAARRTSTRQGDAHVLAITAADDPTPPPDCDDHAEAAPGPRAVDSEASPTGPEGNQAHAAADVLASFCARIRSHPNPLLALDAICFATGLMAVEGLSQAALAARHGVTPAAFSKLAVQMSDTFGIPPSRGMRSHRARLAHRAARLAFLAKHHEHDHAA